MRQRLKWELLYEDDAVIVCVKPAGMAVETARAGQTDLVSELKNYRARKKEEPYIGLVHRLDQPVCGVMVFAKTKQAAAHLSKQVSDRLVGKEYRAVIRSADENVDGFPMGSRKGEMVDYLLRDGRSNTSKVVPKGTAEAKEARLSYEIEKIEEATGRMLVHIWLHTGRHHQIRVQFAHAGYPIEGDTKYGQAETKGRYTPVALCSCHLGFVHPTTRKNMEFDLEEVEKRLGFS